MKKTTNQGRADVQRYVLTEYPSRSPWGTEYTLIEKKFSTVGACEIFQYNETLPIGLPVAKLTPQQVLDIIATELYRAPRGMKKSATIMHKAEIKAEHDQPTYPSIPEWANKAAVVMSDGRTIGMTFREEATKLMRYTPTTGCATRGGSEPLIESIKRCINAAKRGEFSTCYPEILDTVRW